MRGAARGSVFVVMAMACGAPTRASRGPEPPGPGPITAGAVTTTTGAPSAPREIHPGVLRSHLLEGQLIVDDVPGAKPRHAWVRVCVGADGATTATLDRTDHPDEYDRLALAAASAWRFRPFTTAAGAPEAVCAEAHFLARHPDRPAPDEALAGLPAAEIELPPTRILPAALPAGATRVAPAPGLAAIRRCRKPGSDEAPIAALLQSSGDDAFDRRLLARPQHRPADEAPEPGLVCHLQVGFATEREPVSVADRRSPPPPPPPPPPLPSSIIAPLALEQQRIAGERDIFPSDLVKTEIALSGQRVLQIPIKVCIDVEGAVASAHILGRGTGFFAYELDLLNAIAVWRYQPFQVGGVPAPVCSVVQFVYRQV